jgi:hypothetical protein
VWAKVIRGWFKVLLDLSFYRNKLHVRITKFSLLSRYSAFTPTHSSLPLVTSLIAGAREASFSLCKALHVIASEFNIPPPPRYTFICINNGSHWGVSQIYRNVSLPFKPVQIFVTRRKTLRPLPSLRKWTYLGPTWNPFPDYCNTTSCNSPVSSKRRSFILRTAVGCKFEDFTELTDTSHPLCF